MRGESQLSLPQVLERHWRALIHETAMTESTFAANVREAYERLVPPHARTIEWSQHDDLVTAMRRDAEKLHRWFDCEVSARFPIDALEAFIAAFPDDRRFALQQEVAGRQGLLAVPMPAAGRTEDAGNLGRIGKETGEAIIAVAKLLDDGVLDDRDAVFAEDAVRQIDEAVAVLMEMRERIVSQVMQRSAVVVQLHESRG